MVFTISYFKECKQVVTDDLIFLSEWMAAQFNAKNSALKALKKVKKALKKWKKLQK